MRNRAGAYIRQHHLAILCLCLVLGGGTAWALERNSVRSQHIVNGQVKGKDVRESSLGKVPNADRLDGTDSDQFLRGSGRALGNRTLIANGTTTVEPVIDLPEFGGITANCPNGITPTFTFTNESGRSIEVVEVHTTGNEFSTVAPDGTEDLQGGTESPRLIIWRFVIEDTPDRIATVWPLSQKPGFGSNCHFWIQALITG